MNVPANREQHLLLADCAHQEESLEGREFALPLREEGTRDVGEVCEGVL